jgi:hypothetical protein
MSKRILVIDGDDCGEFFLAIQSGTLTLGGNPANAEAILRNLRISHIRCEVEVSDDLVAVGKFDSATGTAIRHDLRPGQGVRIGRSSLRLEGPGGNSPGASAVMSGIKSNIKPAFSPDPPAQSTEESTEVLPALGKLRKRLLVIDGADQGKAFTLPDSGTVAVGKGHREVGGIDIHDLYVSRLHCELHVEGDMVLVVHVSGKNGTMINGERVTRQELRLHDVLRVGNTHLRLEYSPTDGEGANAAGAGQTAEDDPTLDVTSDTKEQPTLPPELLEPYALPHAPVDELLKLEEQVLGHYKVGSLLGRGQSGVVFRAENAGNGNVVALKVLSPDFPKTEAELQRFVKAMKIIPQLPHNNLVAPLGAGRSGLYCWIAREFVEGESLARLIQRFKEGGKFDWTRACRVAVHIGKALYFLHEHKVTHGNITPRNILVRNSDKVTKLADLMLNQALEGSRLQKAILGHKLVAELAYMAPEQSDPHAPGSVQGDIYGLGVVLYAMLTGEPPFMGETPKDVLAEIREGKPARPSKLQKGIPTDFEGAVLKMMARRPEDRFQSAIDMLGVVETIAQEHGIPA